MIRFPIQPRMVPPEKIARRLGVTAAVFADKRAALEAADFPRPDPVLGNYCLQAVDNWIDRQAGLTNASVAVSDPAIVVEMAGRRAWRK